MTEKLASEQTDTAEILRAWQAYLEARTVESAAPGLFEVFREGFRAARSPEPQTAQSVDAVEALRSAPNPAEPSDDARDPNWIGFQELSDEYDAWFVGPRALALASAEIMVRSPELVAGPTHDDLRAEAERWLGKDVDAARLKAALEHGQRCIQDLGALRLQLGIAGTHETAQSGEQPDYYAALRACRGVVEFWPDDIGKLATALGEYLAALTLDSVPPQPDDGPQGLVPREHLYIDLLAWTLLPRETLDRLPYRVIDLMHTAAYSARCDLLEPSGVPPQPEKAQAMDDGAIASKCREIFFSNRGLTSSGLVYELRKVLGVPPEVPPNEDTLPVGVIREVKYKRSFECACGYSGWEYADTVAFSKSTHVCTHCGVGRPVEKGTALRSAVAAIGGAPASPNEQFYGGGIAPPAPEVKP